MTAVDRLATIRARAEAATPGPWETYGVPATRREAGYVAVAAQDAEIRVARYEGGHFDGAFIAAARSDVPALLNAVEGVRDVLVGIETVGSNLDRKGASADYWEGAKDATDYILRAIRRAIDEALNG